LSPQAEARQSHKENAPQVIVALVTPAYCRHATCKKIRLGLKKPSASHTFGYWVWNLDTDRVTWSDEAYRIYGLMPQQGPVDLSRIREMIHPEDRETVFRIAEEAILGRVRPDAEHRIVRPNGEVRTVHSQGDLKRDESGRLHQMFGTVQDITDRKRTAGALRRSQFYLSEGQRLAHMGSWASNDLSIRWLDDLDIYWSDEVYKISWP